ncbi:hypothetical protein [Hymenobacter terrenus]|uniref:hypothetical protein n=1 Tax=Hymenobacter terrenus TaxID=1629124 RepID=UPI000619516D|nr:hypothetical protein [Hymenobacter terrenus]
MATPTKKPVKKPAGKKPVKTGRLDAKKERYQQRMDLIKKAEAKRKTINNHEFRKSIDRLKLNNVAVERWRLATDAYNYQIVTNPTAKDYEFARSKNWTAVQYNKKAGQVMFRKGKTPEGWKVVQVFDDPSTGLNGVLYKSSFEEGNPYVLAFTGTELNRIGGPMIPKDVGVNWDQAHMESRRQRIIQQNARRGIFKKVPNVPVDPQYAQAIAVGQQAVNKYGKGITTAGHSLGGGLASAVSLISDVKGYTFNAAGLHQATVAPYGHSPADIRREAGRIEAFRSSKDELTALQRTYHPKSTSEKHPDVPRAVGNPRTIGRTGHSGTDIEAEFERQKAHDVAQLKHFLNSDAPNSILPLMEAFGVPPGPAPGSYGSSF